MAQRQLSLAVTPRWQPLVYLFPLAAAVTSGSIDSSRVSLLAGFLPSSCGTVSIAVMRLGCSEDNSAPSSCCDYEIPHCVLLISLSLQSHYTENKIKERKEKKPTNISIQLPIFLEWSILSPSNALPTSAPHWFWLQEEFQLLRLFQSGFGFNVALGWVFCSFLAANAISL